MFLTTTRNSARTHAVRGRLDYVPSSSLIRLAGKRSVVTSSSIHPLRRGRQSTALLPAVSTPAHLTLSPLYARSEYDAMSTRRWFAAASAEPVDEEDAADAQMSTTDKKKDTSSFLEMNLSPSQVVNELDRHIVGQHDAKRAVAIAMRNRWRRKQLDPDLQKEVTPRNVLLVGPTGCGKTEVARRMAQLNDAPFIKVEGTQYLGFFGHLLAVICTLVLTILIQLSFSNFQPPSLPKSDTMVATWIKLFAT